MPILATKLYIPPSRPNLVLRPHLIERLNEGLHSKLTLISAPAGFGKTTLVSEWLAGCGRPVAWLSLDEGDNDPARFLAYFIASLQTISANIGAGALVVLQSPQPPSTESILTTLLNEITAISRNFILVLDDNHVIDSKPVDEALAFLLDHLPSQMHLVITTREDPHLSLARLRARGQLSELRAADLRFTPSEAADFLNQVMGLNLSEKDITALETRTEGWIAGLQLAAISMQGRQDIANFIKSFTGSHRFVLDYLVDEVLNRQPGPIRSFLLQTAILNRFCASLCNAVTGREDGKEMLEILERSNLFLIPLDDQRQWYRYHHLFAEVLQAHLQEAQSVQISVLHQRSSEWFERNEFPSEAIHHSLLGKDFEHAADLIEKIWLAMDINYQLSGWLSWAKAIPEELIRIRPVLSVGYAWALLGAGDLEASESRLQAAEQWFLPGEKQAGNSSSPAFPQRNPRIVVVDEAEFRSLPASIAAARAYRAMALGDIPGTKLYASRALALEPENISIHHTQAIALLAMAEFASGNLDAAEHEFLKFQEVMWKANDLPNAISITYILADIMQVQGRLREAVSSYQQSLQIAASRGATYFLGASDLYRGLSELLCEQGELEAAAQYLHKAKQLGEQGATTGWPHRLGIARARLQESYGDLVGALILLDEAERQYVRNPLPDIPIAALKARTWARMGRLTEAQSWMSKLKLSPDDEISFSHEFEYLTLARVLIARYTYIGVDQDIQSSLGLLVRLLQSAEAGGRNRSVIETLILQSLAFQTQDDQQGALTSLGRALELAEPEGYVRIFVDEGETIRLLLEQLSRNRDNRLSHYADKLLTAFTQTQDASKSMIHQKSALIEPLSGRELEVLRFIAKGLSNTEISQRLYLALSTIKGHNLHIFDKLQVQNRTEAVDRARELGLL
jgi:LuxR family maltose regulon positive regulatory protein